MIHSKVVLLGNSNAGKSSILFRYDTNNFCNNQDPTIGASFISKKVRTIEGYDVLLDIWDTAGQERYRSLLPMYYRGASAIIIVFDITQENSLKTIKNWYEEFTDHNDNKDVLVMVVGNKSDFENKCDLETIQQYSLDNGLVYISTSAKTGDNITDLFKYVANNSPRDEPIRRLIRPSEKRKTFLFC